MLAYIRHNHLYTLIRAKSPVLINLESDHYHIGDHGAVCRKMLTWKNSKKKLTNTYMQLRAACEFDIHMNFLIRRKHVQPAYIKCRLSTLCEVFLYLYASLTEFCFAFLDIMVYYLYHFCFCYSSLNRFVF